MCEASAYLLKNGREELVLESVDIIEPEGDGLRLVNIFGEQKVVPAAILKLNLVNHKVILVDRQLAGIPRPASSRLPADTASPPPAACCGTSGEVGID